MNTHPDIRGPLPPFTPGPWHYQSLAGKHEFAVYADSTNGGDVALVRDFNEGNAALSAAAPELLEACKLAYARLKPGDIRKDYAGHVAHVAMAKAIAKAEGSAD